MYTGCVRIKDERVVVVVYRVCQNKGRASRSGCIQGVSKLRKRESEWLYKGCVKIKEERIVVVVYRVCQNKGRESRSGCIQSVPE